MAMSKGRRKALAALAREREHRQNRAENEYQKTLNKYGLEDKRGRRGPIKNRGVNEVPHYLEGLDRGLPATSDRVGNGFKRDLTTDHKWRRDSEETPETIKAIERKAKSVGPAFNKGGMQLLTEGHDPTKDGRRRT